MKNVARIVFVFLAVFVVLGLASVALAEQTKNVEVVNSDSNPIPVREIGAATLTPFIEAADIDLIGGALGTGAKIVDVGVGKRIIAEFVTAACEDVADNFSRMYLVSNINYEGGAKQERFYLIAVPQGQGYKIVSQVIRLYSDEELKVYAERTNISDDVLCEISVTGYIVDVATP
jgi:hypothetical protein